MPAHRKPPEQRQDQRKSRQPRVLPSAQTGVPTPPRGLKAAGKRLWQEVWRAGWLHPTDGMLVELLCRGGDELKELRAAIRTEGRWFENRNGQKVTHPAVKQLEDLEAQVTEWFNLLGFSPLARARLGVIESTELSKLDELDARRRRVDFETKGH
jgi:P27 family predicted phage terminase small subunit